MGATTNWHSKVYGRKKNMSTYEQAEWETIRDNVIARDKYKCQRCGKRYKTIRGLSVHHIIPRRIGGGNDDDNLITLCLKCHDWVEARDFRTAQDIRDSYDGDRPKDKEEKFVDREETFTRPSWHKYVYGGMKRTSGNR